MMQYSCHIGSVFRTGSTYWFWQEYIQFHHCAAASRRITYTFQYSQHSISGSPTPHLQHYPEIITYYVDICKYIDNWWHRIEACVEFLVCTIANKLCMHFQSLDMRLRTKTLSVYDYSRSFWYNLVILEFDVNIEKS